jgi:hypothetical protein
VDGSGNENHTVFYTIQIIDRTLPMINNVNTTYLANETEVLVRANVTDDMGVDSVILYFKAVGGGLDDLQFLHHGIADAFYLAQTFAGSRDHTVEIAEFVQQTPLAPLS